MNVLEKIKRSWWVILSFIMYLNGVGFIYIGSRYNNKNWIIEGITYELPWFFYFIFYAMFGSSSSISHPSYSIIILALLLQFVSIVRSIWVAVKLGDIYDNEEKYTIQSTVLNANSTTNANNNDSNGKIACCVCIFLIFIMFVVFAL